MTETISADAPTNDAAAAPLLALRAHYTKDLSFENPRAPASLFGLKEAPTVEVSINLGAQRMDEAVFEVAIQVAVRAISDKTTIFLSDLVYAGIIEATNIPAEQLEYAVYVQGAQLLFPYARRVISDVTRDGGFPPVMLDPVNFHAMYMQQQKK